MVFDPIKYKKKTEKFKKCHYTVLYGFNQLLTNPKKMIGSFNTVMANLCNKNNNHRILLAGLGGGTIFPGIKPKNKTTLDCLDISSCVIKQFKKFFYPVQLK